MPSVLAALMLAGLNYIYVRLHFCLAVVWVLHQNIHQQINRVLKWCRWFQKWYKIQIQWQISVTISLGESVSCELWQNATSTMLLIASPMRSYLSFFKICSINKHISMNTCFETYMWDQLSAVECQWCQSVASVLGFLFRDCLVGHLPVKVVTTGHCPNNVQSNYKFVLRSLVGDSGDL